MEFIDPVDPVVPRWLKITRAAVAGANAVIAVWATWLVLGLAGGDAQFERLVAGIPTDAALIARIQLVLILLSSISILLLHVFDRQAMTWFPYLGTLAMVASMLTLLVGVVSRSLDSQEHGLALFIVVGSVALLSLTLIPLRRKPYPSSVVSQKLSISRRDLLMSIPMLIVGGPLLSAFMLYLFTILGVLANGAQLFEGWQGLYWYSFVGLSFSISLGFGVLIYILLPILLVPLYFVHGVTNRLFGTGEYRQHPRESELMGPMMSGHRWIRVSRMGQLGMMVIGVIFALPLILFSEEIGDGLISGFQWISTRLPFIREYVLVWNEALATLAEMLKLA